MTHDVFVSYSHGDKASADAVVAGLEQRDIRCWVAPRDIVAGSTWGGAIVDAISEAQAMVLLLSAESNQSRQVLREVERAIATETIVVPFRIEDVEATGAMSYFLGTEHWLDAMTAPLGQHIEVLSNTLGSLLDRSDEATAAAALTTSEDGHDAPTSLPPPAMGSAASDPSPIRSDEPDRSRRSLLVGAAAIGSVVIVGLLIVLFTRGGDDTASAPVRTGATVAVTEPVVVVTEPVVTATTVAVSAPSTMPPTTTTPPTTTPPTTTTPATTAPSTPPTTEATAGLGPPPTGSEWYDGSPNGFAIALPADWLTFDFAEGDLDDLLEQMEGLISEEMIEGVRQGQLAGIELTMLAFPSAGDENVNVSLVPLGPFDTLDVLEASAEEQLASISEIEFVSVDRLQLDTVEAVLIHTRGSFPDGEAEQYQYFVIDGRTGYLVTFTSFRGDRADVYTEIMRSFTLTG